MVEAGPSQNRPDAAADDPAPESTQPTVRARDPDMADSSSSDSEDEAETTTHANAQQRPERATVLGAGVEARGREAVQPDAGRVGAAAADPPVSGPANKTAAEVHVAGAGDQSQDRTGAANGAKKGPETDVHEQPETPALGINSFSRFNEDFPPRFTGEFLSLSLAPPLVTVLTSNTYICIRLSEGT